jgi:alpha-tubulin suppressor-like RCC1 family protein
MATELLIWGRNTPKNKTGIYRDNKVVNLSRTLTLKREISNVFIKDDCALLLSGGVLYKQGKFRWETVVEEKPNSVPNMLSEISIKQQGNEVNHITWCSIGDDHVLVLTQMGTVYSWGDNYYGQLGVGNFMIPSAEEPQFVKINDKVRKIYTHKHNSLAIDVSRRLYIWGRNEFAMTRANRFKPTRILHQFNIEKLKIEDNRIIVRVNTERHNKAEEILLEDAIKET